MKRLTFFCISFLIFGLMFVTLSNAKIDYNTDRDLAFEEKEQSIRKILQKMGITE